MNEKKKIAAAVSGVLHYLRTEQEALALSSMAATDRQPSPAPVQAPPVPIRAWGLSGRREQMQVRNLMQLRTFKTLR
jgi:hypothetical protein